MKKLFVVFMIFAITMAMSAGGAQQAAQVSGASIVTAPGTFPVVNQPVTLKVFASGSPSIENFETNEFTKFYEQKSGVKLDWQIAPPNSVAEQRRLSLAGGDLPDFYMNAGFSKNDEVLYGTEGVLIPLNALIDRYGFYMNELWRDIPDAKSMLTAPDGNIYSLGRGTDGVHSNFQPKYFINSDWMKALNLRMPDTLDDLYNVLSAFKTRDPNRNGRTDEIPMITENPVGSGTNQAIAFFANSFIQMDINGFLVTANHKVDIAYNKPEFRQTLAYLNRLVSDGLFDPASFSITNAELRQIVENPGIQIVGSVVHGSPSFFYAMTSERQKSFDAVAPLTGPGGLKLAVYNPHVISSGNLAITNKCRYPEVVIRWIDWFFDQEGQMLHRIGREGIEWNWAAPGELSYTGDPALWINIGAQGGSTNLFWMQYGVAGYNRHHLQRGAPPDRFYEADGLNMRLYEVTRDFYVPYAPAQYLPNMYFETAVLENIVQPMNDIANYRSQMWARFATGDLPLNDTNWNNYVRTLDQMGVQNVIEANQRTYDTFLRNAGR